MTPHSRLSIVGALLGGNGAQEGRRLHGGTVFRMVGLNREKVLGRVT